MSIKNRSTHVMVMFPADMVEAIESYKDENRIRTRNEAIRTLITRGLKEAEE